MFFKIPFKPKINIITTWHASKCQKMRVSMLQILRVKGSILKGERGNFKGAKFHLNFKGKNIQLCLNGGGCLVEKISILAATLSPPQSSLPSWAMVAV